MDSMQGRQSQIQQKRRQFPWIRTTIALLILLLIATATLLTILNTGHIITGYWYVVMPIIFAALALLIPLGQWLFPISTKIKDDQPSSAPTPIEVKVTLAPPIVEPVILNAQAMSSPSAKVEQRDHDVLLAIGRVMQAQQGSAEAMKVSDLLPLLEDRYSQEEIIKAIEWFHHERYIQLYKVFQGTLASSFLMTPLGQRKLDLIS